MRMKVTGRGLARLAELAKKTEQEVSDCIVSELRDCEEIGTLEEFAGAKVEDFAGEEAVSIGKLEEMLYNAGMTEGWDSIDLRALMELKIMADVQNGEPTCLNCGNELDLKKETRGYTDKGDYYQPPYHYELEGIYYCPWCGNYHIVERNMNEDIKNIELIGKNYPCGY